jgi:hypothetical protein
VGGNAGNRRVVWWCKGGGMLFVGEWKSSEGNLAGKGVGL